MCIHVFRIFESKKTSLLFNPISVSLPHDLTDPVFEGVGLAGFRSRTITDLCCSSHFRLLYCFFYLSSFFLWVGIVGLGSSD